MVSDDAKAPLIDGENNLAVYTLNSPNFVFDAYDLENISNPYYEYDCEAELYCGTNDKATTPTIKLGTGINVRDLLNCNAIAYQSMEMLPLTYSDLIRFSFSDIPLFGKLLNFFLGGINPT
jgi:hypothetical protein